MDQRNLSFSLLISVSVLFLSVGGLEEKRENAAGSGKATATTVVSTKLTTQSPKIQSSNCTGNVSCSSNSTGKAKTGIWKAFEDNQGMVLRTFYVLIGITSIVIVYFIIRAWRIRRRRSKSRKYGLITTRGSDLEMAPLDQDDDEDDEDMTVFELNNRRKK